MKCTEQKISGLFLLVLEKLEDERGFFARTFCAKEFQDLGLETNFPQANLSHNIHLGTLRGMHFQKSPGQESKIVRCTKGRIFDVVVDVRPDSKTYGHWQSFELSAANGQALYIPPGLAHGFQTLVDDSDVYYHMSAFFMPQLQAGLNPFDPDVNIRWPLPDPVVSPKDINLPPLKELTNV